VPDPECKCPELLTVTAAGVGVGVECTVTFEDGPTCPTDDRFYTLAFDRVEASGVFVAVPTSLPVSSGPTGPSHCYYSVILGQFDADGIFVEVQFLAAFPDPTNYVVTILLVTSLATVDDYVSSNGVLDLGYAPNLAVRWTFEVPPAEVQSQIPTCIVDTVGSSLHFGIDVVPI